MERFEQRELESLRRFVSEGAMSVDDARAGIFQMLQKIQRVENCVAIAAQVGGRAHAIEDQRILSVAAAGVIGVSASVEAFVVGAALIEFREERAEPVGMLVINRDGFLFCAVAVCCAVAGHVESP